MVRLTDHTKEAVKSDRKDYGDDPCKEHSSDEECERFAFFSANSLLGVIPEFAGEQLQPMFMIFLFVLRGIAADELPRF